MPERSAVIYEYDGSFDGLLCCVFQSYTRKETPIDIRPLDSEEISLYSTREIATVPEYAERVYISLQKKLGPEGKFLVERAFLCGSPGKESMIFRFIQMGYRYGPKAADMLGDETVSEIQHMVRSVGNECHQMLEFLRFSELGGGLAAIIEPKHYVLPLMREHFCSRYAEETFLIYDKTHRMALIYRPYEWNIFPVEDFRLPKTDEEEKRYRRLWQGYYDTIAIEERINPRCRMGHMPKRFWPNMVEMQGERNKDSWYKKTEEAYRQKLEKEEEQDGALERRGTFDTSKEGERVSAFGRRVERLPEKKPGLADSLGREP